MDDNRRVFPFAWGLEHIGGRADEPDPRGFLNAWVENTLAHSDEWFAATPAGDYVLHPPENGGSGGRVLTFTSQIVSPWPKNNLVHARFFRARATGPAVVLLAQLECEVGRAGESLPLAEQAGHFGSAPFAAVSRSPRRSRARARGSTGGLEHRPHAAGHAPGHHGHAPLPALAGAAGIHAPRPCGHQHRLGRRLNHAWRTIPPCAPEDFCTSPRIFRTPSARA